MKKILLIDQLSPIGHIDYDNLWIKALEDLGIDFEFIGRDTFIKKLNIKEKNIKLNISEKYYKNIEHKNIFIREFFLLKLLNYIRKKLNIEEYENIIFLSFENFSMFFTYFFHKKNTCLILHNNLRKINKKIVYFIIKYLSKKCILISLDKNIKDNLEKREIQNEKIIYPLIKLNENTEEPINKNEGIQIFSPSISSLSKKIIITLLKDEELHLILKNKNIKLILRDRELKSNNENIVILSKYLSKEEYRKLIINSNVIFLPYSEDFNNRISAILLEAISLNKSLIIPKYNDLKFFLRFKEKNIIGFKNIEELKKIFLKIEKIENKNNYINIKKEYSIEQMKKDILNMIKGNK